MNEAPPIGGHPGRGRDRETPGCVADATVPHGFGGPQGIRLVLDLTADELRGYLDSVAGDFNPAAATSLGIRGYVYKLTRKGRTIAAVADLPDGGAIIGILAGYFNNPAQGYSYVSAFHVRIPFRRMQIGRMLMDRAVEISRDAGFKELRLKVNKGNHPGLGFYERYGFVKTGEEEKQFEMGYDLERQ